MNELKPCPYPDGYPDDLPGRLRWWAGNCDRTNCGCQIKDMLRTAADELDRRAQPDNAPLTLEELRGMDGEPVWVVFDDDSAMYALVDAGNFADELKLTTNWGGQLVLDERKAHIKAIYRRKPESEGGDR